MNSTPVRYIYKLPVSNAILVVLLAFVFTASLIYMAYANWLPRSTNLLWSLSVLSGLLSLFVVWFAIRSQKIGQVELGATAAIVPKASLSMPLITVPYTSIKNVSLVNLKGQKMAIISSSAGEARLNSKWFPTVADFEKFLKALQQPRTGNKIALDTPTEALIHAIRERSKDDPLVGAKIGAKEVYQRMLEAMKDTKGVHIESLLCALGALAGYSCQASVRAQALEKGISENSLFVIMGNDTEKYFFGDLLNAQLAESKYSIWSLAAAAAQKAGCEKLLDINEIFKYTAGSICSEKFGIIRAPENHSPSDKPVNYLKVLWPYLLPPVKLLCPEPENWPILFGLAVQNAIDAGKTAIEPGIALKIVMESALPMSKIDLNKQSS